jgi:hypothetical protein
MSRIGWAPIQARVPELFRTPLDNAHILEHATFLWNHFYRAAALAELPASAGGA